MLVELVETPDGLTAGQFLRANTIDRYTDVENGDWKLLMWDAGGGRAADAEGLGRLPLGAGRRREGQVEPQARGRPRRHADRPRAHLPRHGGRRDRAGRLPRVRRRRDEAPRRAGAARAHGRRARGDVATVYDLLFAQFGVGRGLAGDYPTSYDDIGPYTPAWQEQFTKIGRDTVIQLAREFAGNAEATNGKSMVIVGASLNHWYNNNLSYRAPITALILCGCCGVNGGGMNHYVGQEKLTLFAPWTALAFALDWQKPPRQQQSPTWHYVHSDQWRYEGDFTDYAPGAEGREVGEGPRHGPRGPGRAVRAGCPSIRSSTGTRSTSPRRRRRRAHDSNDEIVRWVGDKIADGDVKLAVDDPDAEESWPRIWLIWRGNAIASSAKGQEFFLRHYLGTHDNVVAEEHAKDKVKTVTFREPAPRGKMDLVVDINFRMDTSALYSDIVLPTATWYEKNDLNTTDLHSYVHPLQAAVPPVWESKSDWEIFKALAKKLSELSPEAFPEGPARDVVMSPLQHDTPDELAQTAGARLARRRVRADPRQDDAAPADRRA